MSYKRQQLVQHNKVVHNFVGIEPGVHITLAGVIELPFHNNGRTVECAEVVAIRIQTHELTNGLTYYLPVDWVKGDFYTVHANDYTAPLLNGPYDFWHIQQFNGENHAPFPVPNIACPCPRLHYLLSLYSATLSDETMDGIAEIEVWYRLVKIPASQALLSGHVDLEDPSA